MTSKKNYGAWYFLLGVLLIYGITFLFNSEKVYSALVFFKGILLMIIPIFVLIFVLMVLTNYFIKPKTIIKHLGKKSGFKGWMIAIVSGILSSGPIYLWYPLLKDMQKQGMRTGLIATFLYNRSIKIPLLPLLIAYFGIVYSAVLMIVIIIVSIFQGLTIERILRLINKNQKKGYVRSIS